MAHVERRRALLLAEREAVDAARARQARDPDEAVPVGVEEPQVRQPLDLESRQPVVVQSEVPQGEHRLARLDREALEPVALQVQRAQGRQLPDVRDAPDLVVLQIQLRQLLQSAAVKVDFLDGIASDTEDLKALVELDPVQAGDLVVVRSQAAQVDEVLEASQAGQPIVRHVDVLEVLQVIPSREAREPVVRHPQMPDGRGNASEVPNVVVRHVEGLELAAKLVEPVERIQPFVAQVQLAHILPVRLKGLHLGELADEVANAHGEHALRLVASGEAMVANHIAGFHGERLLSMVVDGKLGQRAQGEGADILADDGAGIAAGDVAIPRACGRRDQEAEARLRASTIRIAADDARVSDDAELHARRRFLILGLAGNGLLVPFVDPGDGSRHHGPAADREVACWAARIAVGTRRHAAGGPLDGDCPAYSCERVTGQGPRGFVDRTGFLGGHVVPRPHILDHRGNRRREADSKPLLLAFSLLVGASLVLDGFLPRGPRCRSVVDSWISAA